MTEHRPPPGCTCRWRLVTMMSRRLGLGWIIVKASTSCSYLNHQEIAHSEKGDLPL